MSKQPLTDAEYVATLGWNSRPIGPSPIEGGDGNREFFLWASRPQD